MLVRPYDYIIGRINGKFFQSDPHYTDAVRGVRRMCLVYLSPSGDNKNGFWSHSREQNAGTWVWKWKTATCKIYDVKRTFYPESDPRLQTSHKPGLDVKSPDTVEKMSERMLKLKEIEKN